jgi:exodeoxyribonuclease V alpha subunit
LSKVLNHFLDDDKVAAELAQACSSVVNEENDLLLLLNNIGEGKIPKELKKYSDQFDELFENRKFKKNLDAFVRLSLLNLTDYQIEKIVENDVLFKGIASNPYLLYEEYDAEEDDLDSPDPTDEPIDIYKIDVGIMPDRKFVKRHKSVQNLSEDSPERVRSVIINYLESIGADGHCYDTIDAILDDIKEHPLIYKNDITIDAEAIRKPEEEYKSHFTEKLKIVPNHETKYYYLYRIHKAEEQLKQLVQSLLKRPDHPNVKFDKGNHIASSIKLLKNKIPAFDEKQFADERDILYKNLFRKSLFLLTSKPGAGKTFETGKIVEVLRDQGEAVHILAPTGKAVLRLREIVKRDEDANTTIQTIDRFICDKEFRWAYKDWERLDSLAKKEKVTIDNLILDESSMIDLGKLKILTSIIRFDEQYPKRIIIVGDENQLPPIGFGKPFHDIINYIWSDENLAKDHYVHLQTNCRQENDQNILKLATAFTDKRRYYEEALDIIKQEGKVSDGDGLFIHHWQNKEELTRQIYETVENITGIELADELRKDTLNPIERLNRLFGLYKNGHVNNKEYKFQERLKLDSLQLLSPYRPGYSGVLGLNNAIQLKYRDRTSDDDTKCFFHSDKIICLRNRYEWQNVKVDLILSNGSIGVVKGDGGKRAYYFPEHKYPIFSLEDEDNYDLAYGITVHKAQGSDFRNVLLIIPNKLTLLSKELIYTALTRSRFRLFIFVQKADENLFITARSISHLLSRHTSVFEDPEEKRRNYYPEKGGKGVQSKNEYIIYTALKHGGIPFKYEDPLRLKNLTNDIHPDFTITLPDNRTIYWEHLGMLDTRKYYRDWQQRKKHYEEHRFLDQVISTDDLGGLKDETLQEVIDSLRVRKLRSTPESRFSNHHYELY